MPVIVTNSTRSDLVFSGSRGIRVTIYVRQTTRRYQGKTYTNSLLVESIHTPEGPRQKVICSLGDLSPRPAEEGLRLARKVEDALVGQAHLFSPPDPQGEPSGRQVRQRQARAAEQDSNRQHRPTLRATSSPSPPTAAP
jgi:hypothetical protein